MVSVSVSASVGSYNDDFRHKAQHFGYFMFALVTDGKRPMALSLLKQVKFSHFGMHMVFQLVAKANSRPRGFDGQLRDQDSSDGLSTSGKISAR